jgi:hypothetical protein
VLTPTVLARAAAWILRRLLLPAAVGAGVMFLAARGFPPAKMALEATMLFGWASALPAFWLVGRAVIGWFAPWSSRR